MAKRNSSEGGGRSESGRRGRPGRSQRSTSRPNTSNPKFKGKKDSGDSTPPRKRSQSSDERPSPPKTYGKRSGSFDKKRTDFAGKNARHLRTRNRPDRAEDFPRIAAKDFQDQKERMEGRAQTAGMGLPLAERSDLDPLGREKPAPPAPGFRKTVKNDSLNLKTKRKGSRRRKTGKRGFLIQRKKVDDSLWTVAMDHRQQIKDVLADHLKGPTIEIKRPVTETVLINAKETHQRGHAGQRRLLLSRNLIQQWLLSRRNRFG